MRETCGTKTLPELPGNQLIVFIEKHSCHHNYERVNQGNQDSTLVDIAIMPIRMLKASQNQWHTIFEDQQL